MLIMILIVRAFNNYVDPVLSNFDPHPLDRVDKNGHLTYMSYT